jgi:hypothetical protein
MTLREIADEMKVILSEVSQEHTVLTEYPWDNDLYYSNLFSWAHVEFYQYRTADIVHCVIMPHPNDAAGIFGFDVIDINGTRTGLFIDVTPTVGESYQFTDKQLGDSRPLPDWGNFSPYFVAVKPYSDGPNEGLNIMREYLKTLQVELADPEEVLPAQQAYQDMQRSNDKTFKMLSAHIGAERAREFMTKVMFPDVG